MRLACWPPSPSATGNGPTYIDLLVATSGSDDILPAALRTLADGGIAPRAVRVHWQHGPGRLIELRTEPLEPAAIERIARQLRVLSAVSRVAFRTGGVGGWLVGGHAGSASQSAVPNSRSAASEAA